MARTSEKDKKKKISDAVKFLRMESYQINEPNYMRCGICGKWKSVQQTNFTMSDSEKHCGFTAIYQPINGEKRIQAYAPYCKSCKEIVLGSDLHNMDRLMNLLMLLDKPYLKRIWESAVEKHGNVCKPISVVGHYCSNVALNSGDLRFRDSDTLETDVRDVKKTAHPDNLSKKDRKELAFKWGDYYSDKDLCFLKDKYTHWTTRHKCDEYSEEILYEQICLKQLEISIGREKGDNVDKQIDALQKLMKDANVKPIDMDASKNTENVNALGLWILDVEKYRPAEYFKDKRLYEDVDKIKEYCDRFILRPLKNLLTGTRDFDFLYNLEETKVEKVSYQTEEGDE